MAATPKDVKKNAEDNSKAPKDVQKGKKESEMTTEELFNVIADEIREGKGEESSKGHQILIDLKIKSEHPVLTFQDEHGGRNLIHIAAKYHRHETLLYLVEHLSVSPILHSKAGHIPLEYNQDYPEQTPQGLLNKKHTTEYLERVVTQQGQIQLQFNRIANLLRKSDSDDEACLYLSSLSVRDKMTKAQKQATAAVHSPKFLGILLHRDKLGRHLIHIAAKYLRFKTIQYMVEHLDVEPDLRSSPPQGSGSTAWEFAHHTKNKQADPASQTSWALINPYLVNVQKQKQDKKKKEEKAKQEKQGAADQQKKGKELVHQYPQHLQGAQPKQQAEQDRNGTWLFKLSNEKEKIEFDLLGTCHVIPLSQTPACVQDKVNKATYLLSETGKESWVACLAENIKKFDGYDLQQSFYKFDAETQKIVKDALEGIQGGKLFTLIPTLKPWVILSLVLSVKGAELQITQSAGMDDEITKIITLNNGAIYGLETYEDRIKASGVNNLNLLECQVKIKQFSTDLTRSKLLRQTLVQEIMKAYMEGNIQKIAECEEKNNSIELQFRNLLWMMKLPAYLEAFRKNPDPLVKKPSALVAVGAAHLVGKTGLLSKLSALGYKIERYSLSGKLLPFHAESSMPKKPGKK